MTSLELLGAINVISYMGVQGLVVYWFRVEGSF